MASIFRIPNVIITGKGARRALRTLPELRSKHNALFITDNIKVEQEIQKEIIADLASLEITVTEFHEVTDRVSAEMIQAGLAMAQECRADLIVAIGGRSAIKAGKLIGMLVTNGGSLEDYRGFQPLTSPPLTIVAIAMTASSGAAISNCACYNDDESCMRCCISDTKLIPTVAILDPGLTNWLSPQEIAADGIVSFGYAIEALASDMATPVTDSCALAAITNLVRWLPDAYTQSQNMEAREKLMYAQQLVSMARSNAIASMVCKLAGQLEVQTHIPLGNAVAALLPHVLDHYQKTLPGKVAMIGEAMVHGDATLGNDPQLTQTADKMRAIIQRLDMPLRLSFLGLEEGQINGVITALESATLESHTPLASDAAALIHLLKLAM